MSQILLPQRFWAQPQYPAPIDYGGLGRGVQLLFNPALGPVDLATGRVWTAGGDASVVAGQKGKAFAFDGTDDYYGYTGYPEITGNVGTFFLWCPIVGPADNNGHLFFGHSSPTVVWYQVSSYNSLFLLGTEGGGTISWYNTANRSLIFSSGGTAATAKAYLDGRDSGVVWGAAPTSWGVGNKNFNLGRYVGGSSWDFSGTILVAGYTSAVWGESEAREFHRNPWALFKAPARRLWVSASSGVTVTLSGQALAGSQGSLGVSTSVALSGQQGSLSSGALSTAGDSIVALSGQSLSSAQGLLFPEIDVSLTGQSLSSSQGGLGTSLDVGLSGQALVLSQGTIGTQGDVTVALTGVEITASQGTLSPPQPQSEGGHFAGVGVVGKKRKKRDLVDRDRDEIRHHLKLQLDEAYAALFQPEIPAEIQEQAAAVIKQLKQPGRNDNIPALQQEVFHIRQMLTLWEQQARQQAEYQRLQRQAEEDEELLMMFL
jgi:hypothetical protein